jgi:GABA permease/S-methylmethionine transporter
VPPALLLSETNQWSGFFGSMLIVLYAYTGTGIIGMAATETDNVAKSVPTAGLVVAIIVTFLYAASCWLLSALLPPQAINIHLSPFVAAFSLFSLPYASNIVNFILVTAVFSSLNSQVYSASRMLFSLAQNGQAPRQLTRKNAAGTPVGAVYSSGGVLLICAWLSFILPEKIFIYLISASGVLALVNWLSVSATHYFYRKKYFGSKPEKFSYCVPFYPYLSWLCFAAILICLCSAILVTDQIPAIWASVLILGLLALVYRLQKK